MCITVIMQFMFYMHTCVRESRSCFVIRVEDEEHGCDFGCSGSPQLGQGSWSTSAVGGEK